MEKEQKLKNYLLVSATEKVQVDTNDKKSIMAKNGEADDLLGLVEDALCGRDVNSLDAIFIDVGPGSFTGIRASMSLVKGLTASNNVRVVPFTSFDMLSYNGSEQPRIEVVAGFSNFAYARFVDEGKSKMDCLTFDELALVIKEKGYAVFTNVQGIIDKLAGLLSSNENLFLVEKSLKEVFEKYTSKKLQQVEFLPIYLRASQAEIVREAKLRGQ